MNTNKLQHIKEITFSLKTKLTNNNFSTKEKFLV